MTDGTRIRPQGMRVRPQVRGVVHRVLGVVPGVQGVVPRVPGVVPRVLGVVPRVLGGRIGRRARAVRAPCGRRANSWYCSGPVRVREAAGAAEAAEVAEVAVQGLGFVSNGSIYLKMEGGIGHTLRTPLGTVLHRVPGYCTGY